MMEFFLGMLLNLILWVLPVDKARKFFKKVWQKFRPQWILNRYKKKVKKYISNKPILSEEFESLPDLQQENYLNFVSHATITSNYPKIITTMDDAKKYQGDLIKQANNIWKNDWFDSHRNSAVQGLKKKNFNGYMEIRLIPSEEISNKNQNELLNVVSQINIGSPGWPIGVIGNNEIDKPKSMNQGIFAEVTSLGYYDYWGLDLQGSFFSIMNLFEDDDSENQLHFDIRIMRVVESLLFCRKLYLGLGKDEDESIFIRIKHEGLQNRRLGGKNYWRLQAGEYISNEDRVESQIIATSRELKTDLEKYVRLVCDPLFIVFDFFQLKEERYGQIIKSQIEGR